MMLMIVIYSFLAGSVITMLIIIITTVSWRRPSGPSHSPHQAELGHHGQSQGQCRAFSSALVIEVHGTNQIPCNSQNALNALHGNFKGTILSTHEV